MINREIALAFPKQLRDDVLQVVAALAEPPSRTTSTFQSVVDGEVVVVPYRVYYNAEIVDMDRLTSLEQVIVSAIQIV